MNNSVKRVKEVRGQNKYSSLLHTGIARTDLTKESHVFCNMHDVMLPTFSSYMVKFGFRAFPLVGKNHVVTKN